MVVVVGGAVSLIHSFYKVKIKCATIRNYISYFLKVTKVLAI
jgi:hypothetical protein